MPHEAILIRLEEKLDKIQDKISNVDSTLAAQHVSLADHIRRTELLEKQMEPVKKHVNMVHGALKLVGLTATVATVVEVLFEVMK